ncbi:MAG: hypothetical protein ABIJ15_06980 [bacterium]
MRNFSKELSKLSAKTKKVLFEISEIASERNEPVFLVGGFARDLLLRAANFDIDCVVEGDSAGLAKELSRRLKADGITINKKFHTAKIKLADFAVDIASARSEVYSSDGKLPDVTRGKMEEDAVRRDFTVNALYISINKSDFGLLCSRKNYLEDLKKGLLRAFHKRSFYDDPTRIFRAVRFAARFNFKIEPVTKKYLKNALRDGVLKKISSFRLKKELFLLLEESEVAKQVSLLFSLGINKFLLPGVSKKVIPDLKTAQDLWLDFFIYFREKINTPLFFLLVVFANTPLRIRRRISEKLALTFPEKRALTFSKNTLEKIKNHIRKNLPDWPALLAGTPFEIILFVAFLLKKESGGKERPQKKVFEYLLHLQFKKPFHTSRELIRMGFPDRKIGKIRELLLKERLGNRSGSKTEEYRFLQSPAFLKKIKSSSCQKN